MLQSWIDKYLRDDNKSSRHIVLIKNKTFPTLPVYFSVLFPSESNNAIYIHRPKKTVAIICTLAPCSAILQFKCETGRPLGFLGALSIIIRAEIGNRRV